ncbi:Adenosine 5'-monophosphoramidase (plasmid) [Mycetohabitans rhizoxinica HKI 454]|uniref:Adenosine 5'-monophosphoramidase n=1 Tax=Mycetohabitans rhizoxinica (strain DSM 19002 / CIP 109453 / HKI 454) TaxID=882378 RepID=E5ATL0_MYCRK|nr:Adenosine 5'-monophosphoramidase [Mycetohabitans rhizoxinica HKI 454]
MPCGGLDDGTGGTRLRLRSTCLRPGVKAAMSYDPNNPFARILRGELPCVKVAETGDVLAFMDLMPQANGHVLVVPKEAAAKIFDLSDAAGAACDV